MNLVSNIYGHSDYREFLKDRYRQLKENDPAFSFRYFSKQAGFGSPNYLKLVMDGKRNLSEEAIKKFAKGLRLNEHETEYFRYMVSCNQCTDANRRRVYEAKLLYLRELFRVKELIPELYEYYHDWYHATIREMVMKRSIANDPKQIAESLVPAITVEEATKSIQLLKELKFIEEDAQGMLNALEGGEAAEATRMGMAQKLYQEQMAELAVQSLYMQGPESQGFESVTVSLPVDKMQWLKEQIHELVASIQESKSQEPNDAIYQLNIQLFALTRESEKEQTNSITVVNAG